MKQSNATGQRIKERRKELHISADDLAAVLGKNRTTVYRYENGEINDVPTQVLEKIAKALKTTPAELMGWSVEATRFQEKVAKPFNDANSNLLPSREKALLETYRKLNTSAKDRVDRLATSLLEAQRCEEDLYPLAAHERTGIENAPENESHDKALIKDMAKQNNDN